LVKIKLGGDTAVVTRGWVEILASQYYNLTHYKSTVWLLVWYFFRKRWPLNIQEIL